MLEYSFAISELQRKLANIIRIGVVKEIDYDRAIVQIGGILTDWLPWITFRAGEDRNWFPPSIDEQVVVLSPSGGMAQGIALPAIYYAKYPLPEEGKEEISSFVFKDGAKLSYDQGTHHLEISIIDKITLTVGESSLEMTNDGIRLNAKRVDLN